MTLENWLLIEYYNTYRLCGDVFRDEKRRFKDGDNIVTSEIKKIDFIEGKAWTKNSEYKLGLKAQGTRIMPSLSEEGL